MRKNDGLSTAPQDRVLDFLRRERRGRTPPRCLWNFGDIGWAAMRGAHFGFRVRSVTVYALARRGLISRDGSYRGERRYALTRATKAAKSPSLSENARKVRDSGLSGCQTTGSLGL